MMSRDSSIGNHKLSAFDSVFNFIKHFLPNTILYVAGINIMAMGGAREGLAGAPAPPRKTKAPRSTPYIKRSNKNI